MKIKNLKRTVLMSAMSLAAIISLTSSAPAQIVTDGRTNTSVGVIGHTTTITTLASSGANGFNSFSAFNVGAGETVNMVLPTGTQNLINIINSSSNSQINGIVNGLKDGTVGGNLFFANPYGMIVGAQGAINAGSLTITTPTVDFVNKFFTGTDTPDSTSLAALLAGTAPINSVGAITNNGVITVASTANLTAGTVSNMGKITTDSAVQVGDVVNINADSVVLGKASKITSTGGVVKIVADNIAIDPANVSNAVSAACVNFSRKTNGNIAIVSTENATSTDLQLTQGELNKIHTNLLVLGNTGPATDEFNPIPTGLHQ